VTAVIAESTGTVIEAAATQACLAVTPAGYGRIGAVTRYGVVYASPVDGTEVMVNRLFLTDGDAAEEARSYKIARVVKVFVEVSDV
jgi:hypothetical protein